MRARPFAFLAVLCAWACGSGSLTGEDAGIVPLSPDEPTAKSEEEPACRRLANFAGDAAARAFGGWREGRFWVLAAGGGAGGLVPARVDPGAPLPLDYVLDSLPGTCHALAVARDAPVAVAACNHDFVHANPDGGDELFLIDLDDGDVSQLTSVGESHGISAVTIDAAGARVVYQVAADVRLLDLATGETRWLGIANENGIDVLRMSADGRKLLLGDADDLRLLDLEDGSTDVLVEDDPWIYEASADLDETGRLVVWLGADPVSRDGVEVLLRDCSTGETRTLTDLPAGPSRVASPRIARDGSVVSFLATDLLDAAPMSADFTDPWLIALAADGTHLADIRIGAPATDLAMDPDGAEALVRAWFPGFGGASLVRVDLASGVASDAFRSSGIGEVVDVSGDGRLAAVKRLGEAGPASAIWRTDGSAPPIELPWVGALDARGSITVALRPGEPFRKVLAAIDVASGEQRIYEDIQTSSGDPFVGPAGVLLSGDGRKALIASSVAVGRHPLPEGTPGRRLWMVDLASGEATLVEQGLGQTLLAPAIDHRARRVLYWVRAGTLAELRLYDAHTGERRVLAASGVVADAERPVAISPSGGRIAFCRALGFDATCRLVVAELDDDGDIGLERRFPGLDVTGSLAIDDAGVATFVGLTPGGRGLHRFDSIAAELERLAPPVMLRALVRGRTCAWNALDGGAIVARPGEDDQEDEPELPE